MARARLIALLMRGSPYDDYPDLEAAPERQPPAETIVQRHLDSLWALTSVKRALLNGTQANGIDTGLKKLLDSRRQKWAHATVG